MSKFYLLTINTNWADEMDIDAHIAMNQQEFAIWKEKISKVQFPANVCIGSNEDIDITKREIKTKEITEEDYNTLVRLNLQKRGFSECIDITQYDWNDEE